MLRNKIAAVVSCIALRDTDSTAMRRINDRTTMIRMMSTVRTSMCDCKVTQIGAGPLQQSSRGRCSRLFTKHEELPRAGSKGYSIQRVTRQTGLNNCCTKDDNMSQVLVSNPENIVLSAYQAHNT